MIRSRDICGVVLLSIALTGCPGDQSLYELHRGDYPVDYKQKVRTAIETRWPVPRTFTVLGISQPYDGYLMKSGTFRGVYGAWLGCVQLKGDPKSGANFDTLYVPYAIGTESTTVALRDERQCHHVKFEPWPEMQDGPEI